MRRLRRWGIMGRVATLVATLLGIWCTHPGWASETEDRYLLVYELAVTSNPDVGVQYTVIRPDHIDRHTFVATFTTIEQAIAHLNDQKISSIKGLWKIKGRIPVGMELVERVEPETVKEKRWTAPQWRVEGE